MSPNPENPEGFKLAIELAKENGADLIIGTDPDADRVGVAVKHEGEYVLLTGNMTGIILMEYLLSQQSPAPNAAIISTIVSTDMARAMAVDYGAAYFDVLTGFKYIGEKIREFEESGSHTFVFGFEESYGYLTGTYARDKDAVAAALLVCEAAAFYRTQGLTLYDVLQRLYARYGYYRETISSITLKGVEGLQDIQRIMTALRAKPPAQLAGARVVEARDYLNHEITHLDSGAKKPTTLPSSDVLYYAAEDGSWACVRPSGTEPKVKIYFGVALPPTASVQAAEDKLSEVVSDMKGLVERILASV